MKKKHKITKYGHPILQKVLDPVPGVTPEIVELSEEMIVCMHQHRGVGLAANQIGLDMTLAVIEFEGTVLKLINPRIIEMSGTQRYEEGCLSIPGVNGDVTRARVVTIEYTTVEGNTVTETYEDHVARIIQHEVDHLNGLMIVSHLSVAAKALHKKTLKYLKGRTLDTLKGKRF